jgi:hypothetical protein
MHKDVQQYLESGKKVMDSHENVVVLVRKISLEYLEKNHSQSQFTPDPFRNTHTNKAKREDAIKQALAQNDTTTLAKISVEILKEKRKRILDEATSLMIQVANGKMTPSGRIYKETTINGKTVKTVKVLYSEDEKLNQLKDNYCKVTTQIKNITANQRVDLTR